MQGRGQGEADATLEPAVGEGFVQEEGGDVAVAGVAGARRCAVCEQFVDEDALGVRDDEPDCAGEELRVRLARDVVAVALGGC